MSRAQSSRLLNAACYGGDHEQALRRLAEGADPLWRGESGKTALHFAAMGGHAELCSFLAAAHPEGLLSQDGAGMTPLHLACRNAKLDAALALLRAGADLRARDEFGRMPLECCPDPATRQEIERVDFAAQLAAAAAGACSRAAGGGLGSWCL